MDLYPYRDQWAEDDPHANFKAEVAQYSALDPLPTLENLSRATGIPKSRLSRRVAQLEDRLVGERAREDEHAAHILG